MTKLKEKGYEAYVCDKCGKEYARLNLSMDDEGNTCPPCSNEDKSIGKSINR